MTRRSAAWPIVVAVVVVLIAVRLQGPLEPRPSPEFPNIGLRVVGQRLQLSEVALTLKRTLCHSTCPVYTLTLSGTGRGIYEGEQFVKTAGRHEFTFDPEDLLPALRKSEASGFFNFQHMCRFRSIHAPSIELALTTRAGTSQRRLQDTYGRGSTFDDEEGNRVHLGAEDLADEVDRVAAIERWIGTREERQALFAKGRAARR